MRLDDLKNKVMQNPKGFELIKMAEEVGFEPTVGCPTAVFKTAAIGHSATLPHRRDKIIQNA